MDEDRAPIWLAALFVAALVLAALVPEPPPYAEASGVQYTVTTPLGVCGTIRADSAEVAADALDALVGDGQIADWGFGDDEVDVIGADGDHAGACAAVLGAFGVAP